MHRTKYILRASLLLLIVFLLINLYRKTDDNIAQIAKFKLETLNKIKTDSLDTERKLDVLIKETAKFNEQFIEKSPEVKGALRYVMGTVGLLIALELGFFIAERKRSGE